MGLVSARQIILLILLDMQYWPIVALVGRLRIVANEGLVLGRVSYLILIVVHLRSISRHKCSIFDIARLPPCEQHFGVRDRNLFRGIVPRANPSRFERHAV